MGSPYLSPPSWRCARVRHHPPTLPHPPRPGVCDEQGGCLHVDCVQGTAEVEVGDLGGRRAGRGRGWVGGWWEQAAQACRLRYSCLSSCLSSAPPMCPSHPSKAGRTLTCHCGGAAGWQGGRGWGSCIRVGQSGLPVLCSRPLMTPPTPTHLRVHQQICRLEVAVRDGRRARVQVLSTGEAGVRWGGG